MADTSKIDTTNRIIFVEPNDVYEVANGKYLTPPYEDMCIAFNLIVENYPRFRSNIPSSQTRDRSDETKNTAMLSWFFDRKKTDVSFMAGNTFSSADGTNYLTTYYTDISFDNYGDQDQVEKRIVEGLGVESIQVSFESWYTPTIVIKFVDVRGSAFWGNEEAIHENNKITANNIFGSFFTFPYPKFKLQIKGFLGKPVTFQMTCSSFTGEYDSQTGNFNVVAQFVGYTYSLLTDIPIDYLVCAPYCNYVGKSYWNEHAGSQEWALDDGTPPITMDEFFRRVEQAQKDPTISENQVTAEETEMLKAITDERKVLYEIRDNYEKFYAAFSESAVGKFEYNDKKQVQVLFFFENGVSENNVTSDTLRIVPFGSAQQAFKNLSEALTTYNSNYSDNAISTSYLPNRWKECPTNIEAVRFLNITHNDNGTIKEVNVVGLNGAAKTAENIQKIKLNDGKTMYNKIALDVYHSTFNNFSKELGTYAYLLDLYTIESEVKDRLDKLRVRENKILTTVDKRGADRIKEIVGFKPYIGNVFKMIMCHLETFLHIVFEAGNEMLSQAKEGKRTPSYLGVSSANTDIVSLGPNGSLPPWPLVMNEGVELEDGGDITDTETQIAWVGDFSHNFIEEEVVLALQSAVRRIVETAPNNETSVDYEYLPILPADFISGSSVFSSIANNTDISSVAAMLSFRASQILGVMNGGNVSSAMAKLFGRMDAYNYIVGGDTVNNIKNKIFDVLGNGNIVDVVEGISVCDSNYDTYGVTAQTTEKSYHKFETSKQIRYNDKMRDPILSSYSNSNYLYCHYYNENEVSFVPHSLLPFERYKEIFEYNGDSDDKTKCYFKPKFNTNGEHDWLNVSDSSYLVDTIEKEQYINDKMFRIITNNSEINGIYNLYGKMKQGGFKIADYDVDCDFSGFLKDYWNIDEAKWYSYFKNANRILSPKKDKYSISDADLLPVVSNGTAPIDFNVNSWLDANKNISVYIDEENKWHCGETEVTVDTLCFQQFKVYETNDNAVGNIFGHPFYYMQNNIADVDTRLRVKALLFLHTLNYNYSDTVLNVFSKTKKKGSIECVPYGYLLLLGGLLWRHRYMNGDLNNDPIVYDEGAYHYTKATHLNGKACEMSLFVKKNDGQLYFYTLKSGSTATYNKSVASFFGYSYNDSESDWLPDLNVTNQLIKLFEDFVKADFSTISLNCELTIKEDTLNYSKMLSRIKEFSSKIKNSSSSDVPFDYLKDAWSNWMGTYRMITVLDYNNPCVLNMLLEENSVLQQTFIELYSKQLIVCDSCYRRQHNKSNGSVVGDNDRVFVSKSLYRDYVSGFTSKLKEFVDGVKPEDNKEDNLNSSEQIKANRDYEIAIYLYIKHLWDSWLLSAEEDEFDVDVFFKKNFFFIDSFYRNTYSLLPLNCGELLNTYANSLDVNMNAQEVHSLFSFLNDIISKNRCIFFSLPDYVGFNGKNADIKTMENLFKPIPFNEMPAPELHNKFVIIYTHNPSEVGDENGAYKYDGFDLWSTTNKTGQAPTAFKTSSKDIEIIENTGGNDKIEDNVTRMGYNVPSFGVSVNRQNNHIFKNIKVDMKNPVITDQAIRSYSNILRLGKSGERRVAFHGQDIFPIYSSYSYQCEIEMMGNAQICPLMYFQLLNVPMWRGTYMIFHVTHLMTPGDMTTVIKGMKMSSRPMPFGSTFFAKINEQKKDEEQGSSGSYEDVGITQDVYPMVTDPNTDYYHNKSYQNKVSYLDSYGSVHVDSNLVKLYNQLVAEIKQFPENQPTDTWNICLSHVIRAGSGSSDHYIGHAMDVKVMRFDKNGKVQKYCMADNDAQKELGKVVDLLYCNHRSQVRQVILEYKYADTMSSSKKDYYHVLHIATPRTSSDKHDFFVASYSSSNKGSSGYGCINNAKDIDWFMNNVPSEFKTAAARAYYNDRTFFDKFFLNYIGRGATQAKLSAHFADCQTETSSSSSVETGTTNKDLNARIKTAMDYLIKKAGFPYNAAKGICGNLMRESGLNPKAHQNDTKLGMGIAQWSPSGNSDARRIRIVKIGNQLYGKNYAANAASIDSFNLLQQLGMLVEEMKNYYKKVYSYLKNPSVSADDACAYFLDKFEVPKDRADALNKSKNNMKAIEKVYPFILVN